MTQEREQSPRRLLAAVLVVRPRAGAGDRRGRRSSQLLDHGTHADAAAGREDHRARRRPPARQPQLPRGDQPAGAGRRVQQALQHHRYVDRRRLRRGDVRLERHDEAQGQAREVRRDRRADPHLQPGGPVGAVRRRPRSGRQQEGRRPQAQHPRRRVPGVGRARLPCHLSARPRALDRRHLHSASKRLASGDQGRAGRARGSRSPTTSPAATAWTSAPTSAPSTSPTFRS